MKTIRENIRNANNLRKFYYINVEVGLILSLLIVTTLFKIDFYPEQEEIEYTVTDEIVQVEEIEQTRQESAPPPPPRPPVPVEVPNDEIIADVDIELDTELNLTQRLDVPSRPPEKDTDDKNETEDEIFISVEQMPEMIGGISTLYQNLRYPNTALKNNIEGKVTLQFVINEKGEVTDPVVLRGIGYGCDEEALRVIRELKFTPGLQRGKPVKVRASIQVIFSLLNR